MSNLNSGALGFRGIGAGSLPNEASLGNQNGIVNPLFRLTQSSQAGAGTLTVAQLLGGSIDNTVTGTLTLPTGTVLTAGVLAATGVTPYQGMSFQCVVSSAAAVTTTIAGAADCVLQFVGLQVVNTTKIMTFIKGSAANAWVVQ